MIFYENLYNKYIQNISIKNVNIFIINFNIKKTKQN